MRRSEWSFSSVFHRPYTGVNRQNHDGETMMLNVECRTLNRWRWTSFRRPCPFLLNRAMSRCIKRITLDSSVMLIHDLLHRNDKPCYSNFIINSSLYFVQCLACIYKKNPIKPSCTISQVWAQEVDLHEGHIVYHGALLTRTSQSRHQALN